MPADTGQIRSTERKAPQTVRVGFWTLVVVAKVLVLLTAVGAAFFALTSHTVVGAVLMGVGLAGWIGWMLLYRRIKRRLST